ncbi:hypothetical protein QA612_19610 [Evansella sp. AB-P1]|nr:hypothetical protein [Evansella sp. AB-P1]MDG5789668.1 hypothetical protein [Evansella sp. AB-P1]
MDKKQPDLKSEFKSNSYKKESKSSISKRAEDKATALQRISKALKKSNMR